MKNIILTLVALSMLALGACKKAGVLEPGKYYGSVNVSGSVLSSADIDVYLNGKKKGTLQASQTASLGLGQLVAGELQKVSLFKGGTDEKLKDTIVKPIANETLNLEAIYSDLISQYGFWNSNSLKVGADSIRFRIRYLVTAKTTPKPPGVLNATLYQSVSGVYVDEIYVTPTLIEGVYSREYTINRFRPGTTTARTIVIQLKDPSTGAIVGEKVRQGFTLSIASTPGRYSLVTISIGDDTGNPGYYRMTTTFPAIN